ncbi:MAG TPA: hypothetical protein VII19_06105, partial [Acidimicrobiales bacterium]
PAVTEATISIDNLLRGTGSWRLQGSFGECLSGYTYNHNSGIVRTSNGDLPSSRQLEVIYAVANNNLGGTWGVWDYRLWDVRAPLTNAPAAPTLPAASASCPGLDLVDTAGRVTTGGSALNFGSVPSPGPTAPTAGLALTPDRQGYYLVATNGQITTFGDAVGRGSLPTGSGAVADVVGVAVDASTGGYWIARADGTVSGFGAPSLGPVTPTAGSAPVVGITAIPNGEGYYLVNSSGGVSAFGHATSFGNFAVPPGQSVAAMATTPDGLGYYLITKQGTIATFGNARLFGPAVMHARAPIAALAVAVDGFGYWVVTSTGAVTGYGDAASGLVTVGPGGKSMVDIAAS